MKARKNLESPEERSAGKRPERGGASTRQEGGFADGEFGRGSTPYKRSHSAKPNGLSIADHEATSGRGGSGVFGKGDGFKGHAPDLEHPMSHAEFESLGSDGGGGTSGRG